MAHTCRACKFIKLHKSGMADCQAGNLEAAAAKLKLALHEVQKIGLECYQAKIMNNLGLVFELMDNRRAAENHYKTALALVWGKLGKKTTLCRVLGDNLARVS
jgi:hypothetical protein